MFSIRHFAIGLAMLAGAGLTVAMTPTKLVAGDRGQLDLEALVPLSFGDWRLDTSVRPIEPAPDLKAKLQQIYTATLSRTYTNSRGERIMLSMAYGAGANEGLQTHVPDVCYPAQGFELLGRQFGVIQNRFSDIAVTRLMTRLGPRQEPLTYWLTVGDEVTRVGLRWKLAQLKYGLTGRVPEGLLVRVSSIGGDMEAEYRLQQAFVQQLLEVLPDEGRKRFIGAPKSEV